MKKAKLGKSDLQVFPIGLGTNAVGGHNLYPNLNEETGKELVREAIRNGVTMLDTAYIYGIGRSEELIGEVLREFNREDVVIATKAAHRKQGNDFVFDNSPEFLKKSVDESLKRLNTDYIDLFYIHFPDEHTPKDEAVNALNEMKKAGKIRSIGVSNFSLEQLKEANKDGLVDVLQGEYNLLNREAEKHSSRIRRSIIFHLSLTSRSYQVYWQESIQKIQRSQKATCETNRNTSRASVSKKISERSTSLRRLPKNTTWISLTSYWPGI